MSTPVHRAPTRQSLATVTATRQRREQSRDRSVSGNSAERALLQMQSSVGNRATTAAVQRARATTKEPETAAPGNGNAPGKEQKKGYRDRMAAVLDTFKRNLDQIDTFVKGVQTPTNAGLSQTAAAAVNDGLKHSAAASGTAAASENLLTEATGGVVSGLDAYKSSQDAKKFQTGAQHHTANKKAKTKGTDAVISAVSSGSYSAAIAKEATKLQMAANAAMAAEASGALSGAVGGAKGIRAGRRVTKAARKYKNLRALGDPRLVHAASLAQLEEVVQQCNERIAQLYAKLEAGRDDPERDVDDILADLDAYADELDGAREAAEALESAQQDVETLAAARKYAKRKQLTKIGKEAAGGVGESAKAAAGVVTVVAAAGAGLASNPVGWGLAAAGAGLILGATAYKGYRAATKRYEEARHPERWGPKDEDGKAAEGKSRGDALKDSLKFWKKVEKGERQAKARDIYALAAGPDIPGSGRRTDEMRASARALLVALKAGPDHHKLDPDTWADTLNDPAKSVAWIKEIAEQLASG
jgi:hypothetical protein